MDGIEYVVKMGFKGDVFWEVFNEFDGVVCWSGVKVILEVLDVNCCLKVIVWVGVGMDNIDKIVVMCVGIVVMNILIGNMVSIVEYVVVFLFGFVWNIVFVN